jgi:hypothetical protein
MIKLLNDNGIIIVEVHYFKNILDNNQFDFIYHEHHLYYTITSFCEIAKRNRLMILDIEKINIHGGSIRVTMMKPSVGQSLKGGSIESYELIDEPIGISGRVSVCGSYFRI